ncbi:MAG TPA: hypothetical protein DER04_00850 [Holosporales bacterium]|nr:hypothetical protein [Holosporales bacterium]HCC25162.1 hypothetical protein [Holosporales bacterium]HCE95309.1 hypothetical protein [Holosporales bacterium]
MTSRDLIAGPNLNISLDPAVKPRGVTFLKLAYKIMNTNSKISFYTTHIQSLPLFLIGIKDKN